MSSYENEGDFAHIPVLGHFGEVVVDGVERGLVFQTEHEDHGVDPSRELEWKMKHFCNETFYVDGNEKANFIFFFFHTNQRSEGLTLHVYSTKRQPLSHTRPEVDFMKVFLPIIAQRFYLYQLQIKALPE